MSDSVRHRALAGARRVGLGLIFVGVTVITAAPPVAAHTALEASSPKDGARLGVAPGQVELDFTGPVRTRLSLVIVRGPGGQRFEVGSARAASDKVVQPLRALGTGAYQITYRVVALDGHPLTGVIRFTLTRPGPSATATSSAPAAGSQATAGAASQATAAAEPTDSGSDVPLWWVAIGAAGLMGCVTGAMWFGRRVTRDLD